MRVKRYSPRTEKTYCYWIRYFIRFHGIRHLAGMGGAEVRAFLEHLAVERQVAAATQNRALNALVFLYRPVLDHPWGISKKSRPPGVRDIFPPSCSIRQLWERFSHATAPTWACCDDLRHPCDSPCVPSMSLSVRASSRP
ncbi:site-specific integrase [Halomonas lysinitropha]